MDRSLRSKKIQFILICVVKIFPKPKKSKTAGKDCYCGINYQHMECVSMEAFLKFHIKVKLI